MSATTSAQQGRSPTRQTAHPGQVGPPLWLPAISYAGLTIASVVLGSDTPRPDASAEAVLEYYRSRGTVASVTGTIVFAASIPLAIFTATVHHRLRRLGMTAPGATIGLVGGVLAATGLALSGLTGWTAAQVAPMIDPAVAKMLSTFSFGFGSAGFTVPFALLLAGVSVPSVILRLLPRPLAVTGLVIAGVGMLSTLMLVFPPLVVLTPVVRFGGLIWLVVTAFQLPRSRRRRR